MSALRPLRGACQCGRNRYIIAIPETATSEAQVHFNTDPEHQIPLASPLVAYIRVPLAWYHSTTYAQLPDETHALIRRVYTHPSQSYSKRHFCGYCGTPLSYWSEQPHSEADYINLTLGSLIREDLRDLEEMGLLDVEDSSTTTEVGHTTAHALDGGSGLITAPGASPVPGPAERDMALRQTFAVPWFEAIIEGTRLGRMRRTQSIQRATDGSQLTIDWEVTEFPGPESSTADPHGGDINATVTTTSASLSGTLTPGKRKLHEREDGEASAL